MLKATEIEAQLARMGLGPAAIPPTSRRPAPVVVTPPPPDSKLPLLEDDPVPEGATSDDVDFIMDLAESFSSSLHTVHTFLEGLASDIEEELEQLDSTLAGVEKIKSKLQDHKSSFQHMRSRILDVQGQLRQVLELNGDSPEEPASAEVEAEPEGEAIEEVPALEEAPIPQMTVAEEHALHAQEDAEFDESVVEPARPPHRIPLNGVSPHPTMPTDPTVIMDFSKVDLD